MRKNLSSGQTSIVDSGEKRGRSRDNNRTLISPCGRNDKKKKAPPSWTKGKRNSKADLIHRIQMCSTNRVNIHAYIHTCIHTYSRYIQIHTYVLDNTFCMDHDAAVIRQIGEDLRNQSLRLCTNRPGPRKAAFSSSIRYGSIGAID